MSDDAQPDEPAKPKIIFEKAVSGRSTCKATGEKIEKGELRVGLEAFLGGRISMTWQACDHLRRVLAPTPCPRAVLRFRTARHRHGGAIGWHGAHIQRVRTLNGDHTRVYASCRKRCRFWRAAAWSTRPPAWASARRRGTSSKRQAPVLCFRQPALQLRAVRQSKETIVCSKCF